MNLAMIVAVDKNNGIGLNNSLPWHCPEDLKYFKDMTDSSVVVMGMNTYKSLPMYPKGLPNRKNLVITRESQNSDVDNVEFVTLEQVKASEDRGWLMGGARTYEALRDQVTVVSITNIKGDYETDTSIDLESFTAGMYLVDEKELSDTAAVQLYVDEDHLLKIKELSKKSVDKEPN